MESELSPEGPARYEFSYEADGTLHMSRQGVTEEEAIDVLEEPDLVLKGADETFLGIRPNSQWALATP